MALKNKLIFICTTTWVCCLIVSAVSWYLNALAFLCINNWFSRSGALIIIIALLSELFLLRRVSKHYEWVKSCSLIPQNHSLWPQAEKEIRETYIDPIQRIVELSNLLLAILGTIVCAYGDILYRAIEK